ncbi:MAG: aminotransferase class I/II-fold pyridoxal phosphate-dependent enzyme [Planctomycetes bacterium]|nr:aminotransferase class I/II-fold pyridoxal phosphate-dependent enzyme [Planctomycetota bacterium]
MERKPLHDLVSFATADLHARERRPAQVARGLIGSEILKIAGEIRALIRSGRRVCNLTVGDFDPHHFAIPATLRDATAQALRAGETNYPPSSGMLELREAVQRYYERELRLRYPVDSVLIAAGARPLIYGTFRTLLDRGDRVVYSVPSWNNNHYVHMAEAEGVVVPCQAETGFFPTAEQIVPHLRGARLLCLNSPLNPTGTAIDPQALRALSEAILAENRGRAARNERPLYLMFDHIYWPLHLGGHRHVTPPELLPEMARFTVFVDGISKAFAATGLRVGFGVGPVDVMERMGAVLGHVGAWAPRAEQVATARLLDDPEAIRAYHAGFLRGIAARMRLLHRGFQAMQAEGLPVACTEPMGAIYLAVRIAAAGRKTSAGRVLDSNEDVRRFLLEEADTAVVPFQAFGVPEESGWFRLSVGAVSEGEIEEMLPRVAEALRSLH